MRDSWIKRAYKTAKRRLYNSYLIQVLLISLIAEKKEPRRLQKQTKPEIFKLTKRDLLLILCVVAFLMFAVYVTYRTGALESTRYYQIK